MIRKIACAFGGTLIGGGVCVILAFYAPDRTKYAEPHTPISLTANQKSCTNINVAMPPIEARINGEACK